MAKSSKYKLANLKNIYWHLYPNEWQEEAMQGAIVSYLRKCKPDIEFRAGLEGKKRNPQEYNKLKALGLDSGWPDLHFPHKRLWVELKIKGGRLSQDQKDKIAYLEQCGDTVKVLYPETPQQAIVLLLELL